MSYVSIYNMDNPKLSYEMKRKSLIQSIFNTNYELMTNIDPFYYSNDVHDVLVDETYTLTIGGNDAIQHINDVRSQFDDLRSTFGDDDTIMYDISDLDNLYSIYLNKFVNVEG